MIASKKRVWVAGHRGMVGAALVRALQERSDVHVQTVGREELDLTRQSAVEAWMQAARPDWVFLAAAKVGGIAANAAQPAQFLYDNLAIAQNIIQAAYLSGVKKLLFLGSSCIYPKHTPQPIPESALLTGPLEPTNQAYALAKIAGVALCQAYREQYGCNFISAMPTNLYGPGDNYDLNTSHVVPALLRKIHHAHTTQATSVEIWGDGQALREFLHVDDLAQACLLLMERYDSPEPINIGTGKDIRILELAHLLADIIGYRHRFTLNPQYPSGTPRKCLDISKIQALGWSPQYSLRSGLEHAYACYRASGLPSEALA